MPNTTTERKKRLFLVACARSIWRQIPEGDLRVAVETAERLAEGGCGEAEREAQMTTLWSHFGQNASPDQGEWALGEKRYIHALCRTVLSRWAQLQQSIPDMFRWQQASHIVSLDQPPLIREIFGYPFRPVTLDPRWLTSNVVDLARTIYEERTFERLPILADALMDAGCDSEEVIAHCRGEGPHVRGCLAVDLILGKA